MVWHVEGKKTHQSLCVRGKREKRVLKVSVVEKAHSKPKHQNHSFSLFSFSSKTPKPTAISTIPIQAIMKVSKLFVFNKKHKTAVTPLFEMVFECCANSLVPQNTKHTTVEWCMTTMVLSICNEAPPTLNKGMGNTSP